MFCCSPWSPVIPGGRKMETNSAPHPSKEPWIWSPWTPRSLCSSSWVHFSSVKWGRCLTSARSVAVSNITRSGTRLVLAAGTRIPQGNRNYFIEENGSTSAQGEGEDPVTRAHRGRAASLKEDLRGEGTPKPAPAEQQASPSSSTAIQVCPERRAIRPLPI